MKRNFIKINRNEDKKEDIEMIDISRTEEPEKKEEKKGMKKGTKLLIGAGLAGAAALAFFATRKNRDQDLDSFESCDDSEEPDVTDLDDPAVDTVE